MSTGVTWMWLDHLANRMMVQEQLAETLHITTYHLRDAEDITAEQISVMPSHLCRTFSSLRLCLQLREQPSKAILFVLVLSGICSVDVSTVASSRWAVETMRYKLMQGWDDTDRMSWESYIFLPHPGGDMKAKIKIHKVPKILKTVIDC